MNLREAIKDFPDDDWLEIIEQTSNKYNSRIGRAPKEYIKGEVLDYEVLDKFIQYREDYTLHRFLVRGNKGGFE